LLAGLLGAFAFRFGRQWGEGFYLTAMVPGTLWLVLPPWAALGWSFTEVGLVASGPAPAAGGVYYALLGAALMGALASGAALLLGVDGEIYGDADSDVTRNPQFRRAMRARAAGRPREAMELLSSFLATDPDAYEAALALHEVARQARRAADARAALLRVIRIELDRELAAAAVDHWLELIEDGDPHNPSAPRGGAPRRGGGRAALRTRTLRRSRQSRRCGTHRAGCARSGSRRRRDRCLAGIGLHRAGARGTSGPREPDRRGARIDARAFDGR
jgi:hypothetical protein